MQLPQDLPRAGPRWRRCLHRVSCHPRNGPDHKRRGEEDARAAGGARKKVARARLAGHAPSSILPSGLVAPPARPARLVLTLEGAEGSAYAQAQSTAHVRVEVAEVRLGSLRNGVVALRTFYSLMPLIGHLPSTSDSAKHAFTSSSQHVFIERFVQSGEQGTLGPCPTTSRSPYPHFTDGKTEAQINQVTCPRSCSEEVALLPYVSPLSLLTSL